MNKPFLRSLNFSAFGLIFMVSAAFSEAPATSLKIVGTCSVNITGPKTLSYEMSVSEKEDEQGLTTANNILWGRLIAEDMKAKMPKMSKMIEQMVANPRNPLSLNCYSGNHQMIIADFNGKVPEDKFSGKTGSWPLVADSSSSHVEGTITAGFTTSDESKMYSLLPTKTGELKITKYTEKDFEGSYEFKSKEYTVNGKFDFQLIKI